MQILKNKSPHTELEQQNQQTKTKTNKTPYPWVTNGEYASWIIHQAEQCSDNSKRKIFFLTLLVQDKTSSFPLGKKKNQQIVISNADVRNINCFCHLTLEISQLTAAADVSRDSANQFLHL